MKCSQERNQEHITFQALLHNRTYPCDPSSHACFVGVAVGARVGIAVGAGDGTSVGVAVGVAVGVDVGTDDGAGVGECVSTSHCFFEENVWTIICISTQSGARDTE